MSGQTAGGSSGASQYGPTNGAMSIRVLSPGNDGAVSQSNATTAGAIAANGNTTSQSTDQSQAGGGYGSDYTQVAGQEAKNAQSADADAKAVQVAPSNDALSIRVLSPGNDGDVTQSNAAAAGAVAANGNETKQSIDQTQAGSGHGSDATQIAGQDASSRQSADADADAVQKKPENDATSIRVLSPGQRWRRHAVERRYRGRGGAERQRDEAVDRPVAGRLGSIGLGRRDADRRSVRLEQAVRGRGREGRAVRARATLPRRSAC